MLDESKWCTDLFYSNETFKWIQIHSFYVCCGPSNVHRSLILRLKFIIAFLLLRRLLLFTIFRPFSQLKWERSGSAARNVSIHFLVEMSNIQNTNIMNPRISNASDEIFALPEMNFPNRNLFVNYFRPFFYFPVVVLQQLITAFHVWMLNWNMNKSVDYVVCSARV